MTSVSFTYLCYYITFIKACLLLAVSQASIVIHGPLLFSLPDSSEFSKSHSPNGRHNVLYEDYIKEDDSYVNDFTGPDDL